MTLALSLATLALLAATLLPLWRNPHWLVRGWDFPRLQLATIAVALFIAQAFLLDRRDPAVWLQMLLVLACLGWQLWWIVPYTRLWAVEVHGAQDDDPGRRLCIITANVLEENRDASRLMALVREHAPDVLVTLESDQWWQERLDTLEGEMPHAMKCPLDNAYGMHVYSRLPLEEREVSYLVEKDVPSMHALLRLPGGEGVRVHFLHPEPPSPTENPESKERDAELVLVARAIEGAGEPTIVAGDLNDVAWSRTTRLFRKISGLLDPRVGRGMFNTFHARYPFARWPLDHLFHSRHFTLREIRRLPSIGSDHFPLLTRLALTPGAERRQRGLEADGGDRAVADAISR